MKQKLLNTHLNFLTSETWSVLFLAVALVTMTTTGP